MDTTEPVFLAFAFDYYRGSVHGDDDDPGYQPPYITIENAEGRQVAGKDPRWPDGEFDPAFADETLDRMGFRRTGPWEWLNWNWRAPLAAAPAPETTGEDN